MNKNEYKSSGAGELLPYFAFVIVFFLVLGFVLTGLKEARDASDAEGFRIVESSIQRAIINCYASEGKYPPDFDYLKDYYGISIDEEKYFVDYIIFADNIMPEITVLRMER